MKGNLRQFLEEEIGEARRRESFAAHEQLEARKQFSRAQERLSRATRVREAISLKIDRLESALEDLTDIEANLSAKFVAEAERRNALESVKPGTVVGDDERDQ